MSTPTQLEVMLPERWRIPLEVCEKVIDEVGNLRYTWVYYGTLTACALVCRSWVPRSRVRLFQKVDLTSRGRASKFLAVLATSPEFGQLVQILDIICDEKEQEGNGWIYDVLRVLPPLLTNLYELGYNSLPTLHPLFHALSSKFTTVKSLQVWAFQLGPYQRQSFREVIQIVNGFKNLEKLFLFTQQQTPGLYYCKQSFELKSLISPCSSKNATQDICNWVLKSKPKSKQVLSLNKLALPLSSCVALETVLFSCSRTLQFLQLDIGMDFNSDQNYLPSLICCMNLQHILLVISYVEDRPLLKILQALCYSLPNSLQAVTLELQSLNSNKMFQEETTRQWRELDTALSGTKYPALQSIEIQWKVLGDSITEKEQPEKVVNKLEKKVNGYTENKENARNSYQEKSIKERVEDQLSLLDQNNLTQKTFPELYKKKLLWCGHVDSHIGLKCNYIYLICTSTMKSKFWHFKKRLHFLDL